MLLAFRLFGFCLFVFLCGALILTLTVVECHLILILQNASGKEWGVSAVICINVDPGKSHRQLLDICGSSLTCQDLKQLLCSSFNYKFYFLNLEL